MDNIDRDIIIYTQTTIKSSNKSVKTYAKMFMNHRPYSKHVVEFAKLPTNGASVLDVGCSTGNAAKQLTLEKSIIITGIDIK